ncbi:MAG TPA: hypothetical protein PKI01_11220 [Bacteroidales bacterium]|nr:hypothetical protein [Bacteroidales bacterium]
MKKLITFVFSLVLSSCIFAGETASYTLFEAVQNKLVKVVFKGRGVTPENSNSHYGRCISLSIKNITSQRLELKLEAGRKLRCYKDSVQSMMVSKTEMFALGPGNTSDFTINAFCTKKNSGSPRPENVYTMQGMAEGYLYELVQLIENLDCQNNLGQQAVWALTDSISPSNISGDDAAKAKKLRDFVEFAIKHSKSEKANGFNYDYSYPDKIYNGYKIKGEINWDMPNSGTVTLSVYDSKGKKVADIFTGVPFNTGFQAYDYEIANNVFTEGNTYWLRVISGGRQLKEVAVTMK